MRGLNDAFYFIIDKIFELQVFFMKQAWAIGRVVLLIAVLMAAINYALTGGGIKESIIKIGKALLFFAIIMGAYPRIISYITTWTFDQARDSTYSSIESYFRKTQDSTAKSSMTASTADPDELSLNETYGQTTMKSEDVSTVLQASRYFTDVIQEREYIGENTYFTYNVVAPASVLRIILLIAGECLRYSDKANTLNFGQVLKGILCAFFVIFTGVFAVLEYIIAYLEFLLVSSVGLILFPLSLWDGSKFMSEKFIGAMIGFFIKLLFCNIATFLMLYGFMSLAGRLVVVPFSGLADEIVFIVFTCLFFFYICKSAPALAQGLLTGTPSLSATGAISAVTGAVAGAAGGFAMARGVGGAVAGGAAKAAFGASGAITQASSASRAVAELGGSAGDQRGAFLGSMSHSAGETFKASAGDLARSLIGGGSSGGSRSGGSGTGINRHNQVQKFLNESNADGTKKSFDQYLAGRDEAGKNFGLDYMVDQEYLQKSLQKKDT